MQFLKNNKLIFGLIVIIVLAIVGFFVFNMFSGGGSSGDGGGSRFENQNVMEVDPEEIGLELELSDNEQVVLITASKIDGIESLEYELTYDAEDEFEGETNVIPRGAVGTLTISGDEASAEVDLGTCSSGVCKYDKVVSPISVLIKINYENGEVGAAEAEIEISSSGDE